MRTTLGVTYELPADLAIPTCPDCGARWLDGPMTDAVDAAYRAAREAQRAPVAKVG